MKDLRVMLRSFLFAVATAAVMGGYAFAAPPTPNSCQLNSAGGKIKHVIYVQFDNTHLRRDNPNVPSDLEQMPHLLNFLKSNGTLDPNHHTVLISHTANGILTSLTGVYSDRHGMPVSNSYVAFRPNGTTVFPSSFFYWTDTVNDVVSSAGNTSFGMLTAEGKNAPAPWVPFTRAGCDVGAYSTANIVLERTPFDVVKVFGSGSPETLETTPNQNTDFIGIAVHCALGSAVCANPATKAVDDLLPQEPGGYTGYKALFGGKYVNQSLGALKDLDNNVITNSTTSTPGFPGFSPTATQTLGAIAQMQESGIPITIAYIADAHDDRVNGVAFGPGQAGYVSLLKDYDAAFDKFFTRLKADGIDQSNTLFIFTADEGDHFAGGAPTPANCDGVTIACTYSNIGELLVNLNGLVTLQTGNATPFSIHFDMAPTVSITGNPSPTNAATRKLERDIATITALNPISNKTDNLSVALVDPVEMGLLHMITADPLRTPTFTMFAPGDYFLMSSGLTTAVQNPGFAWNHGGIQNEIAQTWLGMVGPGVRKNGGNSGKDSQFDKETIGKEDNGGNSGGQGEDGNGSQIEFSDHTDIRPTMMALLGMQDDYIHDGRVLIEALDPAVLPASLMSQSGKLIQLGQIYKQINAPFGPLSLNSLVVSTRALSSNTTNDQVYTTLESRIANWRAQRDGIAGEMKDLLEDAAFNGLPIDPQYADYLIQAGQLLLKQVQSCTQHLSVCEK